MTEHVLFAEPGNACGLRKNVAFQVRTGALTRGVLELMETHLRLWVARDGRRRRGFVLVVSPDAPIPTGDVARKQLEVFSRVRAFEDSFVALTIEGAGLGVAARRAFYRLLTRGMNIGIFSDVAAAAAWLTKQLESQGESHEVSAFVEVLRARSLAGPTSG